MDDRRCAICGVFGHAGCLSDSAGKGLVLLCFEHFLDWTKSIEYRKAHLSALRYVERSKTVASPPAKDLTTKLLEAILAELQQRGSGRESK